MVVDVEYEVAPNSIAKQLYCRYFLLHTSLELGICLANPNNQIKIQAFLAPCSFRSSRFVFGDASNIAIHYI